jgi:acyl-CoA synthetase (NDP forming)
MAKMRATLQNQRRSGSWPEEGLERLFSPGSVAVIGASDNPAKIGGRPIRYLRTMGYAGMIRPINPSRQMVQGLPAWPSVIALPKPPDLAIVAVPATQVPAALLECGSSGVHFAIVFSAGFSETGEGGSRLEREALAAAQLHGLRVCGPNSLGIISEPARLTATFAGSLELPASLVPGRLALLSQSGALGAFVYSLALEQGLGVRHFVSVGNEVDLGIADYIRHFAADPGTDTIIGYLEGIRDGEAFLAAVSDARRAGKALGFIKVGRSEAGRLAALSHTGAMAGDDAVYDAVFHQAGVARLEGIEELLDFARLRTTPLRPKGPGVAVATISGGAGAWVADALARLNVPLSALQARTTARLAALLPPFATPSNPVDFTPQVINRPEILRDCLATLLDDPNTGSLLVVMGLQSDGGVELARQIAQAAVGSEKLIAVAWLLGPDGAYRVLEEAGIPTFANLGRSVSALAAAVDQTTFELLETVTAPDATEPALALPDCPDEFQAKQVLAQLGVRTPRGRSATSLGEALAVALEIGFPVVLKLLLGGMRHKTEQRLLRLGVRDEAGLALAYKDLVAAAHPVLGGMAAVVLVEEMVPGGVELAVGVNRDAIFGPVVSFGLGGVLVELTREITLWHGPLDRERARRLLTAGVTGRLLAGFRGAPAADVEAAVDCVLALSVFAQINRDRVQAIEINPLVVLPMGQGAVAVDVLLVTQAAEAR